MYQDIFPEEIKQWKQKGVTFVDVREPWEYTQGHLPETKNIPMGELPNRLKEIPDLFVLVCASGNRSGQVALYLGDHGYTQVTNLMGGTYGWQQRGLPIEK